MSDLVARFLPRFAALSRERMARALAIATAGDASQAESVARDMHSMAGEAGMLGLQGVLQAARAAESAARRFTGDPGHQGALAEAVRALDSALAEATRGLA